MVSRHTRRARALAVALLVALMVPTTLASADYYEIGTRFNGVPLNGYVREQSLFDWGCAQAVNDGMYNWINVSLQITPHIREVPSGDENYIRGADKYYAKDWHYRDLIKDDRYLGNTRFYSRNSNGVVYDLDDIFGDKFNTSTGKYEHRAACTHNQNWEVCVTSLYKTSHIYWSPIDGVSVDDYLLNTATHEIGHTLRLAHPPTSPVAFDGDGSGAGQNRVRTAGQKTIMLGNEFQLAPTQYDRNQLNERW